MAKQKDNTLILNEKESIIDFLEAKSLDMVNYINEHDSSAYILIRKYITHSDVATFGKLTQKDGDLERNILSYLSVAEMHEIEKREDKKFETAKQSNITMPSDFYNELGIKQLERRSGFQEENHSHILINDYADVYLVNDTLKYFDINYTEKVFEKLNKEVNWKMDEFYFELSDNKFTEIELRHAIHGIGTSADVIFHKLRRNIFKNDSIISIIEKMPNGKKTLYILMDKNPRFFSIINETNSLWENYQIKTKKLVEYTVEELLSEEKNRKFQNKWRYQLAEEMMNYTTVEGNVFCPFTFVESNFNNVGTLYRASHIKAFEKCDAEEAFDINNGLLLLANADALFDKHLITINENKELIFSFLIDNDSLLKQKLLLNQGIFKMILNDERMKYIEEHRKIFEEKEDKRKS